VSSIKGKPAPYPETLFPAVVELIGNGRNATAASKWVVHANRNSAYLFYGLHSADVESPEQMDLFDSWNEKKHVRWLATYHLSEKNRLVTLTALANVRHRSTALPTSAQFALVLMSRKRRNDVLNDMLDWYPQWVSNKGRFWADVLCWWRIGAALFGGLLDFAGRVAEVVGKFRGAK
jgi:hypothetical protein